MLSSADKKLEAIHDAVMLTSQENEIISTFHAECVSHAKNFGVHAVENNYNINLLSDNIHLQLYEYHKEGIFIQAVWVTYLQVMKAFLDTQTSPFKYPSLQSFHEAYHNAYSSLDATEQQFLWETANWMNILFTLIPARKNKGLAMQIIPKLVEGWHTKYVTGSGQTKATADRVHIFETEGEITANHRGGRGKPKKSSHSPRAAGGESSALKKRAQKFEDDDSDYSNTRSAPPRKRRNSDVENKITNAHIPAFIYQNPINASKYSSHLAHMSNKGLSDSEQGAATDNDDDSTDGDATEASPKVWNGSSSQKNSTSAILPPKGLDEANLLAGTFQLFRVNSLDIDSGIPALARGLSVGSQSKMEYFSQFFPSGLSQPQQEADSMAMFKTFDFLDNEYIGGETNDFFDLFDGY